MLIKAWELFFLNKVCIPQTFKIKRNYVTTKINNF